MFEFKSMKMYKIVCKDTENGNNIVVVNDVGIVKKT